MLIALVFHGNVAFLLAYMKELKINFKCDV
jgi:hypothetical protein